MRGWGRDQSHSGPAPPDFVIERMLQRREAPLQHCAANFFCPPTNDFGAARRLIEKERQAAVRIAA